MVGVVLLSTPSCGYWIKSSMRVRDAGMTVRGCGNDGEVCAGLSLAEVSRCSRLPRYLISF